MIVDRYAWDEWIEFGNASDAVTVFISLLRWTKKDF